MICCDVVLFCGVFGEVVELHGASVAVVVDDAFPVALQDGAAASLLVELPVEVFMLRLLTVAGGCGEIGDAVGLVALRGRCAGDVC